MAGFAIFTAASVGCALAPNAAILIAARGVQGLGAAIVLPAAPGFYQRPQKVSELVDFIVQRIVDHLGLAINLTKRWEG